MKRREADIGLELRTGCPYHADPERESTPRSDVQQRGLADAGLSDQQQRLAAQPRSFDERPQYIDLRAPPDTPSGSIGSPGVIARAGSGGWSG
jgi:hypothetical protein